MDGVTLKSIKCINELISEGLTKYINTILEKGVFPDSPKIAKVTPIYKSGIKTDPNNYRPVSVLPVLSKIFERVLYTRLFDFLRETKFLYEHQYGFRPKSNTLNATIDLVTKITENIDKKHIALGVFIDLKKAFDTISHSMLLNKLKGIGLSGSAYDIFESYITNRFQLVKIDNYESQRAKIVFGIPQGSILGPLLFLIYINNIQSIGLTGHVTLYADDTCLFYFGHSIETVINNAQTDLNILSKWLQCNLLTINVSKTAYMIFSAKNKKIPSYPPLTINNEPLHKSTQERYLGLILDCRLTWKPHIDHIRGKISPLIGLVRKISKCVPRYVRNLIYNSLVRPYLEYLIQIWGNAAKSNLKDLQITQNKIIKVLFNYHRLTSTQIIYNNTKIFNINQLHIYHTCILIQKILTNTTHTQITFKKKTHKYFTRNKNKLELPMPRTNYGKNNIRFGGAKLHNNLPNDVKTSKSLKVFKRRLKQYILEMTKI